MKRSKRIFLKWGELVASLALVVGIYSANSACWCLFHQPKVPTKLLTNKMND